jgi:hypothetical protein
VPGAEGYNNTCYCPGNPALDPNLLNLTGALRRAQARNIFTAPGIPNKFTQQIGSFEILNS